MASGVFINALRRSLHIPNNFGIFSFSHPAATGATAGSLWQRNGHIPAEDPLGKHCFDVSVDVDDPHAAEWLKANEYLYTKWKAGLCDQSIYPVVESSTHPGVTTNVTLRKLGHGHETLMGETLGSTTDCRNDTTSTPISIKIENGAGAVAKVRGCQNQFGCKPYRDCVLAMKVRMSLRVLLSLQFA